MTRLGKRTWILAALIAMMLVTCFGCAQMGKHSLSKPPTQDTREFLGVEVQPVEVGLTTDEVELETPADLRAEIIKAIQKAKIYEQVGTEAAETDKVIVIETKIVAFDKGSQFIRWLIGFGAGGAQMEVACKFINRETSDVIATGTFSGEINGGWFGGSANQETMSKLIAGEVAKFLKKNK